LRLAVLLVLNHWITSWYWVLIIMSLPVSS
jgi:hypothetical protein